MDMNKKNGLNYDSTDFGATIPLVGVDMDAPMDGWDISSTVPLNGGNASADGWASTGATAPMYASPVDTPVGGDYDGTVPLNPVAENWADTNDYKTAGFAPAANDGYAPTMPLNFREEKTAVRPVTGWLVCIDGKEKGKDYRLHADINYIGRSKTNDVVLGSDPTVSRERHAMLAYDNRGKMFFFAPANGSSLVRQNGRPVLSTVELKSGDRLEIGEGTYLFVPLCGENFEW